MPKFTVGLDIAKSVFQVHAIDRSGQVVIQRKLRRNSVLKFLLVWLPLWLALKLATVRTTGAGN